jgi:hypothetical protein
MFLLWELLLADSRYDSVNRALVAEALVVD